MFLTSLLPLSLSSCFELQSSEGLRFSGSEDCRNVTNIGVEIFSPSERRVATVRSLFLLPIFRRTFPWSRSSAAEFSTSGTGCRFSRDAERPDFLCLGEQLLERGLGSLPLRPR
jgi:hypothetical protein